MATAERILDAALELFEGNGTDAVSMSDVRRAARVSNGSLYHHFESRPAIVAALLGRALRDWRQAFRAAIEGTSEPGAVIKAGVAAHVDWAVAEPALARFALVNLDNVSLTEDDAAEQRAFLEHVHGWLDEQAAAGEIVSLPPQLQYAVWLGPAQEHIRAWLAGRVDEDPAAAVAQLGDAAWRALRRPEESDSRPSRSR